MAPFLTKLFQIVSAATTDRCITWTCKGDSFVISDPDTFARDILPTYFKHNNIRSFIRQLNTYGFRKRTNISSSDEHLEFFHTKFRRDEPSLLTQIKRCHQPKAQTRPGGDDVEMGGLEKNSPDIDTIRNRVGELKSRLTNLQGEIREYNSQMEQKVNLLMHILQTATPHAAQLQQIAHLQRSAQQPQASGAASSGLSSQQGQQGQQGQNSTATSSSFNGMGGGSMSESGSTYNAMVSSLAQNSMRGGGGSQGLLRARDPLMASLGGMGGMGSLGIGGLGMGGMGNLGVLGSGMGAGGLGAGLPSSLMAGFGGLNNMAGSKAGVDGGVAGLQHLLEAAQRSQDYSQEQSDPLRGHPAKRFRPDSSTDGSEQPLA